MTTNRFATLSKGKAEGLYYPQGKLDQLETPPEVTFALLQFVAFDGPVLEPACGTGRIVRVLEAVGLKVSDTDITDGADFLDSGIATDAGDLWDGDVITNPPYSKGRAEAFVRKALTIADGKVAMLLPAGFIWGGARASGLFAVNRPSHMIVIPWRILFVTREGVPISGQFNDHCWLVWPERAKRRRVRTTKTCIANRDLATADARVAADATA